MGRPPYKDNDWVLGGPTLSATPGAILKVSTVDCGDSEQNNSLSTDSEELRQASLEMASYWMDAAMRTECLGDSHIEPEQQAA